MDERRQIGHTENTVVRKKAHVDERKIHAELAADKKEKANHTTGDQNSPGEARQSGKAVHHGKKRQGVQK